jgi:hypothetical protein
MAFLTKAIETPQTDSLIAAAQPIAAGAPLPPLDAKSRRIRSLIDGGQYQRALDLLPTSQCTDDIRNTRAVCLMRMGQFESAVQVFRLFALTGYSQTIKKDLPEYIKVNYSAALFFGGQPSGGWAALQEVRSDNDPQAEIIRRACQRWVAEMGFFRRLDWRINRIAPATLPTVPQEPIGRFSWEVA